MNTGDRLRPASSLTVLGAIVATALGLGGPRRAVEAQVPGTIVVTVADETSSEPLEGVRIEVVGENLTGVTDREGRVAFRGIPAGNATLRATLGGYGSMADAVTVPAYGVTLVRYRLPRIEVLLDQILVRVESDEGARSRGHSEARLHDHVGVPLTAADLLAQATTGIDFYRGGFGNGASIRIRGVSSVVGSNAPTIYLDGMRINDYMGVSAWSTEHDALHTLETIPASQVTRIRILRGPAASAQYAESANGVILIETRRGAGGG